MLQSICQQIWKTQQWPQDWKRSIFIPIPKKGNAKECSNCCTIALISHASKVMLKILQARLQQYEVHFQMLKLVLEKPEEPEMKKISVLDLYSFWRIVEENPFPSLCWLLEDTTFLSFDLFPPSSKPAWKPEFFACGTGPLRLGKVLCL